MAQNDRPPSNNAMGNIYNNNEIKTQGKIGNNVINAKRPDRAIDDIFRNFVHTNIPDKTKEIAPMVLAGDDEPERSNFCAQIESFLKSEGYKVRPRVYFLSRGEPPNGVVVEPNIEPNSTIIMVGINTR